MQAMSAGRSRYGRVFTFAVIAYVMHALVFWGMLAFYEAHSHSALSAVPAVMFADFGHWGLAGLAVFVAAVPACLYVFLGLILAVRISSDSQWERLWQWVEFSLGASLVADIILSFPLFAVH